MRIALLSILFLIYTEASFGTNFQLQPESIGAHQPHIKVPYSKGKGVFGLIMGLTLGPVGYAAICIFSHNRITRKKASLGMEIWIGVAMSALIIYLILKSCGFKGSGKGSGAKGTSKSGPDINLFNSGTSGQGSRKRKRKQTIPASPVIIIPQNPARSFG